MAEPLPPDDAPVPPRPAQPPRAGGLRTISAAAAEEVSGARTRPRFLPPPTATPLPPSDVAPATVLMPAPLAHKSRLLSKAEAADASMPGAPPPPRPTSMPGAPPPARLASMPGASTTASGASGSMGPSPSTDPGKEVRPGVGFFTGVAPVAEVDAPATRRGSLLGFVASAVAVVGLVVAAWPVALELSRDDERRLGTLWMTKAAPGRVRADDVARLVGAIGISVAAPLKAELGGREPRFFVVTDDSSAEVFALPDATIAVTTGLLRRLDDSAELAAVLAHSLVHVARGDALAALHAAGDAALVMNALDGDDIPAGLAVVTRAVKAPSSPDIEGAVDRRTREVLAAAGWSTMAPAEAAKALEGRHGRRRSPWLTAHKETPERLAGGTEGGRVGREAWVTSVLGPLSGRR